MDSPQSEPPGEEQKAKENRCQGELQTGDVGAACDAFGASSGGRGAERGSHGRPPEGLQPPTPRRRGSFLWSFCALVRHRWCELVVKHAHTKAYGDVEHFLVHDQAMGVYLYGELMVQEDPQQQALASRCLSLVREEMDQSARRVVEEMVL